MAHKVSMVKLAVLVGALLLQSCGGGEEYAGIDRGGEKPDLSVSGPINGFGSVIVGGVHYNTEKADIFVRGEPADEQQLDVGDYVTVLGRINDAGEGIAHEVHYQPKVTGPIEHINEQRNRISILGQVVQLVPDTHYDSAILPRNIDGLSLHQRVSVSGIAGSDNVIRASRIEREPATVAEVAGMVKSLDTANQVFYLNDLRVEYAFATPQPSLSEGKPVVVRGDLQEHAFTAHEVSLDTEYRKFDTIRALEFRGYVTNLQAGEFRIDGVPAQITSQTTFDGGSVADLADDRQVRARGDFDEQNVLQVEYLTFVSAPVMMSYGLIESIAFGDFGNGYIGVLTISGFNYFLRADTSLAGDGEQRIDFSDLQEGYAAYVSAYSEGEALVLASLAIDNRDTYTMSFQFEGMAREIDSENRQFVSYGRLIQTSDDTLYSEAATSLTAEEFYDALPGKSVRVRGQLEDGILIASRAQISGNGFFDGFDGSGRIRFGCFSYDGKDCPEYKDGQTGEEASSGERE